VIAAAYGGKAEFTHVIRVDPHEKTEFASKVFALRRGFTAVERTRHDFIGIVDGDISFEPDYYARMIEEMQSDSGLGIVGGQVFDVVNSIPTKRFPNPKSVSGGIQLFQRSCFDDIGGLLPLVEGGEDTVAELTARMKGWTVKTLMDVPVLHHKPTGGSRGNFAVSRFRMGVRDHSYGSHILFEVVKCMRQLRARPYILAGWFRFIGFFWCFLTRRRRTISRDLVRFVQRDQLKRLHLGFLVGSKTETGEVT
jgi:hypothetical protein